MDDIPVPPWVDGEMPWPDSVSSVMYLDNADDVASVTATLRLWHDLAVGLLPLFAPGSDGLSKAKLTGMERNAEGRERRVRPRGWFDGLTENLYQLTSWWVRRGPRPGEEYDLRIYAYRFPGGRHLQLATSMTLADGLLSEVLPAVLHLTRQLADTGNAAYGEVMVNRAGSAPATDLEIALRRPVGLSADESRTYLRGYAWVTIVPPELVQRLGGVEGLRASGAFTEVVPFESGGAMLRACQDPETYSSAQARQVFEVVRPVLPPGEPRPLALNDLSLVVFEDAQGGVR